MSAHDYSSDSLMDLTVRKHFDAAGKGYLDADELVRYSAVFKIVSSGVRPDGMSPEESDMLDDIGTAQILTYNADRQREVIAAAKARGEEAPLFS